MSHDAQESIAKPEAGKPANQPGSSGRVLFLAPQSFYSERGSSFRTLGTVTALLELGYQVDLVCFGGGELLERDGLRVVRTPCYAGPVPAGFSYRKVLHGLGLSCIAFFLLLRRRYLAMHAVEDSVIPAALLSAVFRIPYIFDSYSCLTGHLQSLLGSEHVTQNWAGRLLSFAAAGAAGVIDAGERPRVYRNGQSLCAIAGLPLTLFHRPSREEVSRVAQKYGLRRKRVILFVGTFQENDGVELLMRSFVELLQSCADQPGETANLCLVISGRGKVTNQAFRRYRNLATHLGIEHRVVFTGRSAGHEFASLVTLSSAIVCPKVEGDAPSLKLFSFLASGRPLIVTDIPAHRESVGDSPTILVEPTLAGLSGGLRRILVGSCREPVRAFLENPQDVCESSIELHTNTDTFRSVLSSFYLSALRLPNRNVVLPSLKAVFRAAAKLQKDFSRFELEELGGSEKHSGRLLSSDYESFSGLGSPMRDNIVFFLKGAALYGLMAL